MRLYEFENFLSKKLRRISWRNSDGYIYFGENGHLYCEDGCLWGRDSFRDLLSADDWEEYVEPKPKKKYTMYKHWYLVSGELKSMETTKEWPASKAESRNIIHIGTEIIKEFEV